MAILKDSLNISLRTVLLAGLLLIISSPGVMAHTDVTPEQARDLIDSTSDLIVVDVREESEYCDARGHIPGALNYPWNSGVLEGRYEELSMDNPILVVCQSGGRSNMAANFLDSKGFSMVYDMMGGMLAWIWETAPCKYAGGSGTAADPYQIETAEDLMLLGDSTEDYDKQFILVADIDMESNQRRQKVFDRAVIAPDNNDIEPGFQGISFTGVFDGKGHVISNLTIEGGSYLGLFGRLGKGVDISNLGIEAVDVNGIGDYVGGLVGSNLGGSITNCYSTCTVSGGEHVGGLVGENGSAIISLAGTVSNCYSAGAVRGNESVGGLIGLNRDTITNCYSSSDVSGRFYVGGLVGDNWTGFVIHCYSIGSVSGNSEVGGGLVGGSGWPRSIKCSFWDIQTSGQLSSAGGIGKTTDEMQMASTFFHWSSCSDQAIWTIDEGNDYPRLWWENVPGQPIEAICASDILTGIGTKDDPYLIYTPEELQTMSLMVCDWDKHFKLMADIDLSGYTCNTALIAPDTDDTFFTGVFDGNSHTISHLKIEGESFLGLFGQLSGEVKNLGIVDVNISGSGGYVGGLVGCNSWGSVTNCYSTGTVIGNWSIGGLVGVNTSIIATSYSIGIVTGNENVGGLVGSNGIGRRNGDIINCYSTGTVTGNNWIGGLVGYNRGILAHCYTTGDVAGTTNVGGLVGDNWVGATIISSFWDTEISRLVISDGDTGLITTEMQMAGTFLEAGWDFVGETENGTEDIWWIDEGQGYPRLWWEPSSN